MTKLPHFQVYPLHNLFQNEDLIKKLSELEVENKQTEAQLSAATGGRPKTARPVSRMMVAGKVGKGGKGVSRSTFHMEYTCICVKNSNLGMKFLLIFLTFKFGCHKMNDAWKVSMFSLI